MSNERITINYQQDGRTIFNTVESKPELDTLPDVKVTEKIDSDPIVFQLLDKTIQVMIKPNELRIGNLVNKHFEDSPPEVVQCSVRDISDCKRSEVYPDFKLKYTGIPLDALWLLKFEFKPAAWQGSWVLNHCLIIRDHHSFEEVFHISPFKPQGLCKYVHQLQNLYFALTGTELEIKETVK